MTISLRLEDLADQLVAAATTAPSIHNTQPWRFRVHDGAIELHPDPDRMLTVADPDGRALHLSCGAALFNLRLGMLTSGYEPVVHLLPSHMSPATPLAVVRLGRPHQTSQRELTLYHAMWHRHTNRTPYRNARLPVSVVTDMAEAAHAEGAQFTMLSRDETYRILTFAGEADRRVSHEPARKAELNRWTTEDDIRSDGVPQSAFGPRVEGEALPLRDFAAGKKIPGRGSARFEKHVLLATLFTTGDVPVDWLRAGQAMERVLLVGTAGGLTASFLYQPIELADLRSMLRDTHRGTAYLQMIMRIGYPTAPVVGTRRRPIHEVLDVEP